MVNTIQQTILKNLTIDCLTPKQIAIQRDTSIQAVYKIINKLKEKGLLQGLNRGGLKSTTTLGGGGVVFYRLHGLQYDIKILYHSDQFSYAISKGNSIRLLNNTIIFYKEKLEIYQDKESSFTGNTIEECFEKAIAYFNTLICKIESRYNVTLVKEGYHNISIVNGHLAEVNNGIAKELYLSKEYITITGKDGRAWLKIDYSKRQFKEAETIHPVDFKKDAEIIFGRFLNDWRENPTTMTNSELQNIVAGVASNQLMFAKNIELHMEVLQKMSKTLDNIRDELKKQ